MERISFTIERITFQNPDNGYSVLRVSQKDAEGLITVVGTFLGVKECMAIVAEGEWKNNPKFGRQFVAETWHEELPVTVKGIEAYLGSGMIKGIGPKYARQIVKHFGLETFAILDYAPERLLEVQGIGKERMAKIRTSWEKLKGINEVMVFLQGYGVSPAYAVKIYKQYGKDSIKKVKENPYALADDVFGIGFKKADVIAQNLGYGKEDLRRCKAGVIYTLNQLADSGHCFAEYGQLMKVGAELLEVCDSFVTETVNALVFEESLVNEDGNVYLPMYYHSECAVANKLDKLLREYDSLCGMEPDMKAITAKTGIEYDEVQMEAIRMALRSKVLVLTGLPGTGKTTTMNGIIAAMDDGKRKILLAAPTGRAAKRMSEATGREAMTIHRMLEYSSSGFKKGFDNPLEGDVLIVDESSMIDILLMHALLKAVPLKMRVVFVGDIDQLPSVGAGNVLRDIIDSGQVPVVRLTRIFRQALKSRIVTNAHKVNHGQMPDITNGQDTDFFFIRQEDAELAAKEIVGIVSQRIPKAYGYTTNDIQVLVPMKNGAAGTAALNIALQEAINPDGEFIQSGQFKYRRGDRVMQIRNSYEKNVFNGDVGTVEDIDTEEGTMTVRFDKSVEYERGDFGELTMAYACTIHKSQGSEYPVVVMPLLMSHYIMLQRNLLYTGITRAKKLCIVVGAPKAVAMAVHNITVLKRNTRLKERLQAAAAANEI